MNDVAVIVLSYNRPRMLREALRSIVGAAQIVVTDDGSDFDVRAVVGEYFPEASFVLAPPMLVKQRLVTPRLGKLINAALLLVNVPFVTYLCDDDLFHEGWLPAISAFFHKQPGELMTRGDWYVFQDGAEPDYMRRCYLDRRQMTAGNFAHQVAPFRTHGVWWNEATVAVHDDAFLWAASRLVNVHAVPHCGAVAGWRRQHQHNALSYAQQAGYAPHAAELFAKGYLE